MTILSMSAANIRCTCRSAVQAGVTPTAAGVIDRANARRRAAMIHDDNVLHRILSHRCSAPSGIMNAAQQNVIPRKFRQGWHFVIYLLAATG